MNCVVFLLFGFKPLGKGVLQVIYVFIMAIFGDGYVLLSRLLIYFSSASHRCLL